MRFKKKRGGEKDTDMIHSSRYDKIHPGINLLHPSTAVVSIKHAFPSVRLIFRNGMDSQPHIPSSSYLQNSV